MVSPHFLWMRLDSAFVEITLGARGKFYVPLDSFIGAQRLWVYCKLAER